jgi:hypothetical protein
MNLLYDFVLALFFPINELAEDWFLFMAIWFGGGWQWYWKWVSRELFSRRNGISYLNYNPKFGLTRTYRLR